MRQEPNTTRWRRGDIVIHDADAKEPYMLLVVEGTNDDGKYETRYLDPLPNGADPVVARLSDLHDPRLFDIDLRRLTLLQLSYPGTGDRFRLDGKEVTEQFKEDLRVEQERNLRISA